MKQKPQIADNRPPVVVMRKKNTAPKDGVHYDKKTDGTQSTSGRLGPSVLNAPSYESILAQREAESQEKRSCPMVKKKQRSNAGGGQVPTISLRDESASDTKVSQPDDAVNRLSRE